MPRYSKLHLGVEAGMMASTSIGYDLYPGSDRGEL